MKISNVPTARKSFRLGAVMLRRDDDLSRLPPAVVKDLAARGYANVPASGGDSDVGAAGKAARKKAVPAATRRETE